FSIAFPGDSSMYRKKRCVHGGGSLQNETRLPYPKMDPMKLFIFFIISITMASTAVFLAFVQKGRNDLFRKTQENRIIGINQEEMPLANKDRYRNLGRFLPKGGTVAPAQAFAFSRYPESETRAVSQAAERMEASVQDLKGKLHQKHKRSLLPSDLLPTDLLTMIANASGCLPYILPPTCPDNCMTRKYRHITGACNNSYFKLFICKGAILDGELPTQVWLDGFLQSMKMESVSPKDGILASYIMDFHCRR
ncbi:hypothetical protein lerEdw1_001377, partial [Lerista edwardsae]